MGVTLGRAATLTVATAIVTLSSAANADNRYDAARYGGHIRWCSGPSGRPLVCLTFTLAGRLAHSVTVIAATTATVIAPTTDEYDYGA